MKIAIARDGNYVSEHFGHCEGFEIAEVEDKNILKREFLPNPGHKPGFLPKYLSEKNVNVIIAGGMGATAQELFTRNNIEVIVGARGELDAIIKDYVDGNLKSTNAVCREHQHEGHCHG
ncbi:NifB/NifX family molybdenum-iron cluster-binding protein [Paramaledivibacter caminithermalis]|jgi:predicted Fe-Mo cluster-binding NifX family protein|uniref:Predicted Fe-Mo cluster-binding protein, NifX family n=1 Tax=Paramaledivibacter caminithermalis (strain DSM 15212 / CIP 107654 / DViRD3) TaxID=1121301 RepID=A0A1M6S5W5_PARC5|nr:NifB/NifX family molybdenum-iron cluster-binding protein [Paramaledivibacter caminithermalis]SHK40091.1 Predicted Fe-Mo cluster-binding protein, NifX family [Paramaledivibacter caminithermalis DSM 15212]